MQHRSEAVMRDAADGYPGHGVRQRRPLGGEHEQLDVVAGREPSQHVLQVGPHPAVTRAVGERGAVDRDPHHASTRR